MTVLGCDPHLDTFDVVVCDDLGRELHDAHLPNSLTGWNQTIAIADRWQVTIAGVEAASGYGRQLARRLSQSGIEVRDMPTRLTGVMRRRDGSAKTDRGDARAVARLTLAGHGHPWTHNPHHEALRLLTHHRQQLVHAQTRQINQLRAILAEIDPAQAAALPRIRSRRQLVDLTRTRYHGDPHRSTAAMLIRQLATSCLQRHDHIKQLTTHITNTLPPAGHRLIEHIHGIGPIVAATLLAELAGTTGFTNDAQLAAWAGTAPLDASSGRQQHHRLNRRGNRTANYAIHTIALTQARNYPPARTYLATKQQQGHTPRQALRALKRHITRRIYKTLQLT